MRVAFSLAIVLGMSASAFAQSAEVSFEVRDSTSGAPALHATVVDGPRLPASRITLRVAGDPSAPAIYPQSVRSFADGGEPIAIALVLNGQELFIGNDDFETDDNARYAGVLDQLKRGIDTLHLDRLGPSGSTITAVTYSTGAQVLVPTMPLEKFHGDALGRQPDYRNKIGTDMVAGISAALRELDASDAPHKLMIIIGDGNDTNNEAARSELADLKRHAAHSGIRTEAIIYKTVVSADGEIITQMVPMAKTVNSIDGITATIGERLAHATERYYLTFADERLPWDGKPHDMVLRLDQTELDEVSVVLPDHRIPAAPWWHGRFAQLGIGLLLVGLLILGARVSNRS